MPTVQKSIFILIVSVLFTGCATSNYSVKPEYDAKTSMLKVDSFEFNEALKKQGKTYFASQGSNITTDTIIYDTKDEKCNHLIFTQMDSTTHWYLYDNPSIYLSKQYIQDGSGECKVTEIANLKFFECNPKNGFSNFGTKLRQMERYWVVSYTSFTRGQYKGYSRIDALNLGNKQCYDKFYDSLTKKAILEGFESKTYQLEVKDF